MSQIDDFLSGKPAAHGQGESQIDAFLGDAPKRSLTRSVGDSAIALGTGVVQGVKMLADVAGADNAVSRGLGKAADELSDLESPYRKAQKQERAAKIKAAEDSGSTWEEVKAHAGAFADAPIDTTLNAIGTSVPTLATAAIPGLGQAALATRAAQAGVGIAQGVGGIKGQIHETVKQKLMAEGVSESEASQRADAAQAYGGGNMGAIALGGALGGLAGGTGAESAARRLLGRQLAGEAAERAAPGLVRSAVGGVLKEAPMEAVQGGQERLAGNLALQGEGFDVPTWQGVAGQAALEGLASAPMGGGFGVVEGMRARAEAQARQQAEAEALRADPSRAWTTEAGAADPNQPAGERAAPPEAPELQTIPGAAGPRVGLDFTRDVDTAGLTLQDPAEVERARAATMDYEPTDATPQWDTTRGAAAQDRQPGLDMPAPEFDTGALGLESRSRAMTPSQQMGIDPTAGPLSKLAASAVDSGLAQQVQFLGATGRNLQVRRTGPGVADESNVIDVQGRVVEDRAIGTPRRIEARQLLAGAAAAPLSEAVAQPQSIPNAQANGSAANSAPALSLQAQAAMNSVADQPQNLPNGVPNGRQAAQAQQTAQEPAQAGAAPRSTAERAPLEGGPGAAGEVLQGAAGVGRAATSQNIGAQGQEAARAQGTAQAAAEPVAGRPDGWRKSMLKAGPVAKAMGIDTKGKRLAQVVAEIDARDTRAPATPIPAPTPAPGPVRIGRDQTPLSEGGKPFKTRKAAADAKRLQPMMRVVSVEGGYALAEKTPAQLAAEAKAARRLAQPRTSASGEPIAAHAFIAAAGGLSPSTRADLNVGDNPRIGNRRLFAAPGKGMTIEQATERLIAEGYLSEGASHNDAYALIKTSLTRPQYNADGIERIAQAEADARFEDYLAAQEEAAEGDTDPFGMADEFTAEELDEVGYTSADPALQAEVSALTAQSDAMGIDTYAILDDIVRTYADATQDEYNAAAREALAAAIARSNQDGGSTAAQAAPAAEPAQEPGLTAPTRADIEAQQEARDKAEREEAARQRAADQAASQDENRKRIAQASVRAAAEFELGQNPLDSLTGQGSMFDDAPTQQEPAATDGAAPQPITRTDNRKAEKKDAVEAAPIEDAGEKIGGARKDRWKERGLNLDDLNAMTEAEGAELATKANVWKPDYEALSGASEPVTAALVKTIYDQLAAKPKKNTPEGRRQYVQMMRIVRDVYTEAKGPEAVRNAYLEIRKRAGLNAADPAAKAAGRELMFSVYKGRSDPFVLGYTEMSKAKKLVEDGFPAKADPWKSRLSVSRMDGGPGTTERGIEMYMERSAEAGTPLTREQILAGFYRVNTKDSKTVAYAPTKADAEAAAATIYERDMKGKKDGKPEPVRPNLDELKRENLPQRIDRDVTSEDFVRDLGFRGVEFGNWSAQDERQRILNMAYDGLMDLAEIMGVPPKAMSLNGTLGMAFGARGGGRFAAHYEPGKLVINMTKIRGGGSMAHEWAHAMDHYFGELDKADAYTTQARGASGWYSEAPYTGQPIKRMERVGNEWKAVEKRRLDNLRPEMAAAFDEVMRALFQKQITKAEMVRSQELDLERTEALVAKEQDAEMKAMYQRMAENKRQALEELRADPEDRMYDGRGRSDYASQAQALSGKSVDGYWVRPTEMFARAFESWVFDRVTAMGARSDYLVHGVEEDRFAGGGYKGNPYPTGEERARINAAFDKLAKTIKTKQTDKGVAMFSRAPATKAAYEARIDALFAGEKAAGPNSGVRVLDRSDVLSLLGFGEGPVNLAEGKVIKGQTNHQRMTAEQWKKVPEWLDNPAAVFDSDTVPGALVLIAPETINGATVRMTVEPRKDGGADVHILSNAYDAPGFTPFARWFREGLGRLVDQKKFPAVLGDSGLQLSSSTWQNKPGMRNILTEKHLDGYRRKNSPAAMSRAAQPLRTPAATIRSAITKAYGKLLGQLESKGLVTLTQTQEQAIEAAARARADKTGQPLAEVRAILMGSVSNSVATDDLDIRRSANGAIQGFFDPQTGQSFLIADNLTAEAAPGVLMHEVGIHMAADGSMKALFNRAAMMLKLQRGNPFMKAVQARMDAAGETSGEEAAAYIAEAYENDRANAPASVQRWLSDLLAAVKAWMFKKGIMGADRLTVADIAAVARANARSMARDGGATGGQGFGPAFSVGEEVGAKALAEFAKADELFALPKSTKDTVEGIAADIDPEITVRVTRLPGETMYTLNHPAFGVARITERSGNPYGPSLYGYNQVDGEITDQITERPGENPEDVEPGTGDVWVDVSLLKPGQGGEKIYAIAANYAHNTGQIFIGDPAGLSKVALRRRLEQMLSSALKFGTTAHLAPHPDQVRGGDGVPPLQWVYGDHVGNVERMIAASVKALDNGFPQSKLIEYRSDGNFYNVKTGRQIPRGLLASGLGESIAKRRGVSGAEGSTAQAGWRTIARAALFRHLQSTIAAAHGGLQERGRLLAGAGANVSRLHSDGTTGPVGSDQERATRIFYSRAGVSNTGGQAATGWDAPVQTGFDDVIYKLQDKNIDLKRVVESITKATGKVSDSINAYLKEELFHKRAAKRVADFGDRELKPLMNKMRLAGLSMEDVEEYLHARHAKEANAVIAQRNPGNAGLQDGGSGMTNAAADNYFAKLDPAQRRKLEAVAKSVDAIIEGTRKLYVDYGLEDQAVVDGWANMYQHYIPLMREDKDGGMGTGQGFSVKGKETKGRTGSTRKVVDILANVAMQREKLIVRGEKNIVAQALVGLAQANPNPDFWEVRSQAPTERVFDPKTGVVVDRPDPLFKSRENVAVAKVKDANGKVTEQMVVFNEDNPRAVRMAAAMKNLDAGNLEGLLGVSAKITRYFAAINTQYNPVFGVVNLVRDVQGAMVNLGTTPLAGQQGKIAKDTLSALRGIYGDIRKTRKGGQATSQWSQLWEQMQDDGGTTGYRDLFKTSADRANDLKSILNPEGWMDSKWGKFFTADGRLKVPLSMAQKGATEIFGWLSDYNEAMENGVRLAAYKAALDKGMSREQAASLAKNLTVNFNRKGQAGMQAGAVYAFFNAAMQGTARIGQTLFDMDGGDLSTLRLSKTGKAVVYGGVMLGVMQALALSAAGFDDDDPPEFVRERSLIIPTGDKTYVSIPMPLGLHVIPGIGRHATEFALSGFDKPAKRAVSMVGMFADAFNPIGNAGLSMQTIAPTALDPLVALSENKDWTGKPIARVSSNKAMPGHTQWKDTATGFSKVVAEAINWVSGGNEYVAGAFSPTPDQIDYLIAQLGGGVAREAAKVQQTITTAMSGETLPTHKIPLVGRFVGNAASQASQGSAFYANLNKLNELETEIKGLRKDGRFDEAAKLTRENPQSILIAMANRAERDVQRLRREKRELIANDASREQVRAKEDQITDVMTRLNEAVERRKAQAAR